MDPYHQPERSSYDRKGYPRPHYRPPSSFDAHRHYAQPDLPTNSYYPVRHDNPPGPPRSDYYSARPPPSFHSMSHPQPLVGSAQRAVAANAFSSLASSWSNIPDDEDGYYESTAQPTHSIPISQPKSTPRHDPFSSRSGHPGSLQTASHSSTATHLPLQRLKEDPVNEKAHQRRQAGISMNLLVSPLPDEQVKLEAPKASNPRPHVVNSPQIHQRSLAIVVDPIKEETVPQQYISTPSSNMLPSVHKVNSSHSANSSSRPYPSLEEHKSQRMNSASIKKPEDTSHSTPNVVMMDKKEPKEHSEHIKPCAQPQVTEEASTDAPKRPSEQETISLMVAKLTAVITKFKSEKGQELGEIIEEKSKDEIQTPVDALQDTLILSSNPLQLPTAWSPKLLLTCPNGKISEHRLHTREVVPLRAGSVSFLLEKSYQVLGSLPRSYFNILQQYHIGHSFVFDWPDPDNSFFQELAGMRKTAYIKIREEGSTKTWEMHLKPSKERTNLFGYLCKPEDIRKIIRERAEALLRCRKLPLVLDLDDTLVRVVGPNPQRYVPVESIALAPHRVRELKDGRKIMLAERVHEFLEWAQRFFEISICSLGDQPYVDMVVQVLDPNRTNVRGISYSARAEYVHIQQSGHPKRPPKDLISLFAWCAFREADVAAVEPIIIDDNVGMWPVEQQDNIIVVREAKSSPVWNVHLLPVIQSVLQSIHSEYFRQYDVWIAHENGKSATSNGSGSSHNELAIQPPSTIACYKEILRNELSIKIAESAAMASATSEKSVAHDIVN